MVIFVIQRDSGAGRETDSGKKSPQRQVPYEQYEANWEFAFGKKKDQNLQDWTPDLKSRMN